MLRIFLPPHQAYVCSP